MMINSISSMKIKMVTSQKATQVHREGTYKAEAETGKVVET